MLGIVRGCLERYSIKPTRERPLGKASEWGKQDGVVGPLTSLICRNILSCNLILLVHLIHQMSLTLLQHIQLLPQIQDGLFRCISPILCVALAAEPAGAPHVGRLLPVVARPSILEVNSDPPED